MTKIYQKPLPAGKNAGFTLIELLVVVLIIGILAAVALPKYEQAVAKTRYMSLMPLLRAINDAENVYYMANGTYTADFSELDIEMPAGAKTTAANKVEYEHFHCFLREKGNSFSAYCNSKYENMPQVEKYYTRNYFICWARLNNEKSAQLCRSISGVNTPTESNNDSGEKNGYPFS